MKNYSLIFLFVIVSSVSFSQNSRNKKPSLTELRKELIGREYVIKGDFSVGKIWECSDIDRERFSNGYPGYDYYMYVTDGIETEKKFIGSSPSLTQKFSQIYDLFTLEEFRMLKFRFPKYYEEIMTESVVVGMTEREVEESIGYPDRKNTSSRGTSQWVYRYSYYDYIYFTDGIVTSWNSSSY